MVLPDLSAGTPLREALNKMAASGHLSFLMGAGASSAAGLPSWSTLLHTLLVDRDLEPEVATALLARQDALLVAEAAFKPTWRPAQRQARVFKALYGTSDPKKAANTFAPTNIHTAVADHAVTRGMSNVTLMTLNYDDLLEEALVGSLGFQDPRLSKAQVEAKVHGRGAAAPRKTGRYEVHHLHGLLPRQEAAAQGDDLTLALSGYNRLIDDQSSWQFTEMFQARQRGPLLLVGTSFGDPDVRIWLHRMMKTKDLDDVILLLPRQGLGLSATDLATVSPALLGQWSAVGVNCVVLEDYAEVAQTILELDHVSEPSYRPPRDRVAEVLAQRMDKFATRQGADARFLKGLADTHLAPVLGSPTNLTLWLLEGHSPSMVRWATNDRTYTDPGSLVRVPATLESAWVAAQALCGGIERLADIAVSTSQDGADPQPTGRWRSVLARPVTAQLPGGPPVSVGALSSASSQPIDPATIQQWAAAMDTVGEQVAKRLAR